MLIEGLHIGLAYWFWFCTFSFFVECDFYWPDISLANPHLIACGSTAPWGMLFREKRKTNNHLPIV